MSTRRSSQQGIQPMATHDVDDDMDTSNSADEVMSELGDPSAVPVNSETLDLIQDITTYLCDIKEGDDELAAGFQRIPNRRTLPDYFDVIGNPVAFSTIRGKIQKKLYTSFAEFVKDVTQICHNAQVYNRPSAPIFGAAIRLREIFTEQLKRLAAEGKIDNNDASLPDLGELPPVEESMSQEPDSEDEDDDDDEDEDDDEDDDDDDEDYEGDSSDERRRRRGRQASHDEDDGNKKRGRPPLVLTPVEARITAILRGLKNFKNAEGLVLIDPFEKLPDRTAIPDYYHTITNPMAIDTIKKNMKRKKYRSVEQAMSDIDLMFENAKTYNEDESELHQAAMELQALAHTLAAEQLAKPDDDFRDDDGRLPLAEFSESGETWHVGDWVHIRNPNDLAKPTVAQIYRIWQDREGLRWFNACWYYRPEQTVHRFDKQFYEHEVVKTSQYRDHQASEVLDRCFVMFITRFNKGRPRGFPAEKQIYVCESRYNEEKFQFNKIKTWASCLPDEVRDRDYEMDLYDVARPLRKIPSPIKHLLRDDAKETDSLPRPTWGSPNAPPIIGSVHRRPLEQNETPPPHSAAQPPLAGAHSQHFSQGGHHVPGSASHRGMDPNMGVSGQFAASPVPNQFHAAQQPQHIQQTPVPLPPVHQYSSPAPNRPAHIQPSNQTTFVQGYPSTGPAYQQMPAGYNAGQHNQRAPQGGHHVNAYNPPRPPEVYTLPDILNDAFPEPLRNGFQHDINGRVLFFVAPPLDRPSDGLAEETRDLGHSAKYLAGRADWRNKRAEKRKARDEAQTLSKRHSPQSSTQDYHPTDLRPRALDAISTWFGQMEQDTSAWKKSVGL